MNNKIRATLIVMLAVITSCSDSATSQESNNSNVEETNNASNGESNNASNGESNNASNGESNNASNGESNNSSVATNCQLHAIDDCGADENCTVLEGRPYNPDAACFGSSADFLCVSADLIGGGELTYVRDPDGTCWLLAGLFDLPKEYEVLGNEDGEACFQAGENSCE